MERDADPFVRPERVVRATHPEEVLGVDPEVRGQRLSIQLK